MPADIHPAPPICLAIADDHQLIIDGLKKVLSVSPNIIVTGTYHSGKALLDDLKNKRPDILLLDIQLPDIPGKEVAKTILKTYRDIKIIALTGIDSHFYIQAMINAGCMGYILKSTSNYDILRYGIEEVYKGNLFIDPSIKENLLRDILVTKRKSHNIDSKITEREKEVLKLILQEMDNQEIAEKLFISVRTVENHKHNLLHKLNAKNTVGLVKAALEMGIRV